MSIFDPINDNNPVVLTVPGLYGSGPGHWQTRWEVTRPNTFRIELGMWHAPHRNTWVSRLEQSILEARGRVILAAHSLGCIAVAWWSIMGSRPALDKVAGALMVAPADVEHSGRFRDFTPIPRKPLPFRSILVTSRNDPWMDFADSALLGLHWDSILIDAGYAGHINADSGLGSWPEGQSLLNRLIAAEMAELPRRPSAPERSRDPEGFGLGTS